MNYTVIVTLENPEGKLLPGMTARVDFLVKSADERPQGAECGPALQAERRGARPVSERHRSPGMRDRRPARPRGENPGQRRRNARPQGRADASGNGNGTLYTLDAKGKLQIARVRTGISDGLFTEVQGQNVTEGMKVIDGIASASQQAGGDERATRWAAVSRAGAAAPAADSERTRTP